MTQRLLSDVESVGAQTAAHLYDAGIITVQDVKEASAQELIAVESIGVSKLGKLIALDRDPEPEPEAVA
jgi:predicted flap endonuclease-1-like 5' DNA nuclease